MNKKMKVGIVGGGADSFMGPIHRYALAQCGAEVVCGAFGSSRHSSFSFGKDLGLPSTRVYGTYRDMFRRASRVAKDDAVDFVVILTPSGMHYPVCTSAIDASIPIFSEVPFAGNMDEATTLFRKLEMRKVPYGMPSIFPHVPALAEAKKRLAAGEIGTLRKVECSAKLGWMAQRLENAGNRQAGWRTDPRRCGSSGCLTDLGTHCYLLADWLTGLPVKELCAETKSVVPGRVIDDDATVFVRYANGVNGVYACSQVETGETGGLAVSLYGDKGALKWSQARPDCLGVFSLEKNAWAEVAFPAAPAIPADLVRAPSPAHVDATYVAALVASYKAFIAYLQSPKSAPADGFTQAAVGLQSVAFNSAAVRNITPLDPSLPLLKWTAMPEPLASKPLI